MDHFNGKPCSIDMAEKKHSFTFKNNQSDQENLEVIIVEGESDNYSSVIWPSAAILAQFICDNPERFRSHIVLELGAGTGLCGIVTAKIGAQVVLTDIGEDSCSLINKNLALNHVVGQVRKLIWGNFQDFNSLPKFDYLIGSDVCYDETEFENLISTVSMLLRKCTTSNNAIFYMTYQLRCSTWNIECCLKMWGLQGKLLRHQDYTIFLYEIKLIQ